MMYPYFVQAGPCFHQEDLMGWFRHFERKGIGCCIVRSPRPVGDIFNLWRTGQEFKAATQWGRAPKVNSIPISGTVVQIYDPDGIFSACGISLTRVRKPPVRKHKGTPKMIVVTT